MPNVITYTATEARRELFEILNMVRYGENEVRIVKNNRPVARVVKDLNDEKRDLMSFAGCMSEEDAEAMKKVIKEFKKLPARGTKLHTL